MEKELHVAALTSAFPSTILSVTNSFFSVFPTLSLCLPLCLSLSLQDAKFVEERRKQLQGYLRTVMNKLIQTLPEFTARPSKETLLSLLPFCL